MKYVCFLRKITRATGAVAIFRENIMVPNLFLPCDPFSPVRCHFKTHIFKDLKRLLLKNVLQTCMSSHLRRFPFYPDTIAVLHSIPGRHSEKIVGFETGPAAPTGALTI